MLKRGRAETHGHANACSGAQLGRWAPPMARRFVHETRPGEGFTVLRRFRKDHTLVGRYVQLRGLRMATRKGGRPDASAARRRSARPDCGKGGRRRRAIWMR